MALANTRTRNVVVALVVAGWGTTAAFAYSRARSAAERAPQSTEAAGGDGVAREDALGTRLLALERQVGALTRALAAREQDFKDVGELTAARNQSDADRAREAAEKALSPRERAAMALVGLFSTLDKQLEASAPDPAWRPESQAREVLGAVAGTQITSLRCGPAHCRVELALATADDRNKVAEAVQTRPPFSEGVAFRNDPETPLKTVLYFQRPGVPLGEAS